MEPAAAAPAQRQFPCKQCGANLQYAPGTDTLVCPYCGAKNEIPKPAEAVEELDYLSHLNDLCRDADCHDQNTVMCTGCAAETTMPPDTTAARCPFCGSPIVATASSKRVITPKSLLPFRIPREQATQLFRGWIASRWFAPGDLVRLAEADALIKGVYIPAWTYDADAESSYTGERGDDYWATETYTEYVNGRAEIRTRQVLRTRWWPVSGRVTNEFDDVLVLASNSLPRKYADALEPWDTKALVPYGDEYLSGFLAESYQVDLPSGFEQAKQIMAGVIHETICRDIGGDHQRVNNVDTRYDHITFKHILLPVWISAYRYQGRPFRFLVNARTGEIQGERPYSVFKIAMLVITILAALAAVFFLTQR
jgi:DNA-directed RNA polymerase subunit RPC12/RpoP